jgi:SHAQKYF class myb-like DNA-binding protein
MTDTKNMNTHQRASPEITCSIADIPCCVKNATTQGLVEKLREFREMRASAHPLAVTPVRTQTVEPVATPTGKRKRCDISTSSLKTPPRITSAKSSATSRPVPRALFDNTARATILAGHQIPRSSDELRMLTQEREEVRRQTAPLSDLVELEREEFELRLLQANRSQWLTLPSVELVCENVDGALNIQIQWEGKPQFFCIFPVHFFDASCFLFYPELYYRSIKHSFPQETKFHIKGTERVLEIVTPLGAVFRVQRRAQSRAHGGTHEQKPRPKRKQTAPVAPQTAPPATPVEPQTAPVEPATPGTHMRVGRWTLEEHTLFLAAYEKHGRQWKKLAEVMKETRTYRQTHTHGKKYLEKLKRQALKARKASQASQAKPTATPAVKTPKKGCGDWTPEEQEVFLEAFEKHGANWTLVNRCISTRNYIQVCNHGRYHVKKLGRIGRWSKGEHFLFVNALKHSRDWKKISIAVRTRTSLQCRTHAQKYFEKQEAANAEQAEPAAKKRRKATF